MMNNDEEFLIIYSVQKDSSLKPIFDACVNMVLDGSARVEKTRSERSCSQRNCFRAKGTAVLAADVLAYYLQELDISGFDFEKARDFTERMRQLLSFNSDGWGLPLLEILEKWFNLHIRDPYFYEEKDAVHHYLSHWHLKQGEPHKTISEVFFKFSCYIAICYIKYGPSYFSVRANRIFDCITALGSDLPTQMKKNGSGELQREILEYKDALLSCKANDAFATIKVAMKEESQANYEKTLDFILTLLSKDFPHSYSIEFRSPQKSYLSIKGLPKKGVHQLFANAIQYPALNDKIEQYAWLAMKEYEWYTNLEAENCAMPGTFAVFALGLSDEKYHALVCDYLKLCDGEHQGIQGQFVLTYIEKYGFSEKGLELYDLCEKNIQYLPKKLTTLYMKRK